MNPLADVLARFTHTSLAWRYARISLIASMTGSISAGSVLIYMGVAASSIPLSGLFITVCAISLTISFPNALAWQQERRNKIQASQPTPKTFWEKQSVPTGANIIFGDNVSPWLARIVFLVFALAVITGMLCRFLDRDYAQAVNALQDGFVFSILLALNTMALGAAIGALADIKNRSKKI